MRCVVRLAKTLGADFEPFLHTVLPALLSSAEAPKTALYEEDEDDDISAFDQGNEVVVRTEALEEQEMACQLVRLLAEALADGFGPYVEQSLVRIGPVCSNSVAEEVRIRAVTAVPQLVKCAALTGDQAKSQRACAIGIGALLTALETEDDNETRLAILQALRHTIEDGTRIWIGIPLNHDPLRVESTLECFPLLINTSVNPAIISNALLATERAMIQRRAIRLAEAAIDVDYDEERELQDKASSRFEVQGHFLIADALGSLLRTHGAIALCAILEESGWPSRLRDMAQPACIEDDRCFAAYVLADLFDYGLYMPSDNGQHQRKVSIADLAVILRAEPLELLLLVAESQGSAGRRQAAIFGLGRAALRCGFEALAHCLPRILTLLINNLRGKSTRLEENDEEQVDDDDFEDDDDYDNSTVADNAASALYYIIRAHPASLKEDCTAWNIWLDYLPLLADAEEADVCARGLCSAILEQAIPQTLIPQAVAAIARIHIALEQGGYCGTTATDRPSATSSDNRLKRSQAVKPPLITNLTTAIQALQTRQPHEVQLAFTQLPNHLQATLHRLSSSSEGS